MCFPSRDPHPTVTPLELQRTRVDMGEKSVRDSLSKQEQNTSDFGCRFGYRRQFALISASYAKLQVGMGLAGSLNTLDYAYLS
jgi:hypothetical protein